MKLLRPLVAVCVALSLLLSGGVAFALGTALMDHDRDHSQAAAKAAHESADHEHANPQTELFSKLFGEPGFDQLTSSCIAMHDVPQSQDRLAPAAVVLQSSPDLLLVLPALGPPPKLAALHRGGGAVSQG
ncbi:MAG: hypothetical protein WAO95_12105 [Burkholderiales bacterium]